MTTLKLSAEFCFQFQDIDDLRLLGNNAEMINTLEIPLCTILRLKDKLNNLCEGNIPFPVVDTCTFTKIRYPGYNDRGIGQSFTVNLNSQIWKENCALKFGWKGYLKELLSLDFVKDKEFCEAYCVFVA